MGKDPYDLERIREALRLLGNPYAKLQIFEDENDDGDETIARDFHPLTVAESAYVRMMENPYASLSIAIEVEDKAQEQSVSKVVVPNE